MKHLDAVELGKRLWRYFIGNGCRVHAFVDTDKRGRRECHVEIDRESSWTGKDFQTRTLLVVWKSFASNDSFDRISRHFAEWYCGKREHGLGKCSNRLYDEFVSADTMEELDIKLAARGY